MDDITLGNLKKFLGLCINSGLLRKKNIKLVAGCERVVHSTLRSARPYRMFSLVQSVLCTYWLD